MNRQEPYRKLQQLTTKENNTTSIAVVWKISRPSVIRVTLVFALTFSVFAVNQPVSAMVVQSLSVGSESQSLESNPLDNSRREEHATAHELGPFDRRLVRVDRIRHSHRLRHRYTSATQHRQIGEETANQPVFHCFTTTAHQSPPLFQPEHLFVSAIRNATSLRDVYRALYVDGYSLPDDVITCIIESQLGLCAAVNQSHPIAHNRESHRRRRHDDDGGSPRSVVSKKRCRRSESENQYEEVFKHQKYLRQMNDCSMCVPRPVIERIGDRPADTVYVPDYTVVYRCPSNEAVCQADGWQCVVAESEKVRRAFLRIKMPEIANSTEWKVFTQHTKCVCVDPQRLSSSEESSGCSFLSCPSPFKLNVTATGRPCRCEKNNRLCENIASGRRTLGTEQLRCVNEGICHSEICNKSLRLNKTTGFCEKSINKRKQSPRT